MPRECPGCSADHSGAWTPSEDPVCVGGTCSVPLVPPGAVPPWPRRSWACCLTLGRLQMLLQANDIKLNPVTTMYYMSPCCFVFLSVPFTLLEGPLLFRDATLVVDLPVLLSNACCAFALNLAVFLLIGRTSALTMNIAGARRSQLARSAKGERASCPCVRPLRVVHALCGTASVVGAPARPRRRCIRWPRGVVCRALCKAGRPGSSSSSSGIRSQH